MIRTRVIIYVLATLVILFGAWFFIPAVRATGNLLKIKIFGPSNYNDCVQLGGLVITTAPGFEGGPITMDNPRPYEPCQLNGKKFYFH